MDEKREKFMHDLFRQALYDAGKRLSSFAFDATPNSMGLVMDRFEELCAANDLDPKTGEYVIEPNSKDG